MRTPEGRTVCGSHRPGHDPHWIQVLRVAPQHPRITVEDLRVSGTTGVHLRIDGGWQRFGNHRPDRVLDAWRDRTGSAWWIPGARLLRIEGDGGDPCFDLGPSTRVEPCAAAVVTRERLRAEFAGIVGEVAIAEGEAAD